VGVRISNDLDINSTKISTLYFANDQVIRTDDEGDLPTDTPLYMLNEIDQQ